MSANQEGGAISAVARGGASRAPSPDALLPTSHATHVGAIPQCNAASLNRRIPRCSAHSPGLIQRRRGPLECAPSPCSPRDCPEAPAPPTSPSAAPINLVGSAIPGSEQRAAPVKRRAQSLSAKAVWRRSGQCRLRRGRCCKRGCIGQRAGAPPPPPAAAAAAAAATHSTLPAHRCSACVMHIPVCCRRHGSPCRHCLASRLPPCPASKLLAHHVPGTPALAIMPSALPLPLPATSALCPRGSSCCWIQRSTPCPLLASAAAAAAAVVLGLGRAP